MVIVYILVALIVISFGYLIFPVLTVLINGSSNDKLAHKLSLINSVVVGIIFTIILFFAVRYKSFALYDLAEYAVYNAIPALIFYYVNKKIFTSKKLQQHNQQEDNVKYKLADKHEAEIKADLQEGVCHTFCSNCGSKLKEQDVFCFKCGTKKIITEQTLDEENKTQQNKDETK